MLETTNNLIYSFFLGFRERIPATPPVSGIAKYRICAQHRWMVSRKRLFDSEWYVFSLFRKIIFVSKILIYLALLNLNWAKNPESLSDPLNWAMVVVLTIIAWASSVWYYREGIKASALLIAFAGIFQVWAALC